MEVVCHTSLDAILLLTDPVPVLLSRFRVLEGVSNWPHFRPHIHILAAGDTEYLPQPVYAVESWGPFTILGSPR